MHSLFAVCQRVLVVLAVTVHLQAANGSQTDVIFQGFDNGQASDITINQATPDTAILANESDRAIVYMAVRYTFKERSGHPIVGTMIYMNWEEQKDPVVAPHAHFTVRLADASGILDSALPGSTVSGQLDVVIFSDGEVVGPDRSQGRAHLESKRRARRDMFNATLQQLQAANSGDVSEWLENSRENSKQSATDYYARYRAAAARAPCQVQASRSLGDRGVHSRTASRKPAVAS